MESLPISKQMIEQLVSLLIPFRAARKNLCKNSHPTFHEVSVVKQFLLKNHLNITDNDLPIIEGMKLRLKKSSLDKLHMTNDHLITSFLTPGLKTSFMTKYFDQQQIKLAKDDLRQRLKEHTELICQSNDAIDTSAKRPKKGDMFASYYSCSTIAPKYQISEIERYQTKIISDSECDENPLLFWSRNSLHFPKLSKIATELISIPATSVKSEQDFSAAGRLINDRRTSLKSDNVDALLFGRFYMSFKS